MTRTKVLLLTPIMAPHRIAPFNALAAEPDVQLRVVFLARSAPNRLWPSYEREMAFDHRVLRELARVRRGESYAHLSRGLLRELRAFGPDVVVAGGWDQPAHLEAQVLRGAMGYRLIWWVESTSRDRRDHRSWVRLAKRGLASSSDGVVVPGRASLEYVESLGADPARLFVAPNAVDNDFYRARRPETRAGRSGSVRFLFAGRLESSKGVLYLMDAWSRMRGDVELAVAGEGSLGERLRLRVDRADLPPVGLVGHLDRDRLAGEYAAADAFVFPSLSDPWGLVINEAMAAGLPIVASSAPGAVDDLVRDGENGFVVAPGEADGLARAMQRLTDDAALRARMGARSSEAIAAFGPDAWAAGIREAAMATAARETASRPS